MNLILDRLKHILLFATASMLVFACADSGNLRIERNPKATSVIFKEQERLAAISAVLSGKDSPASDLVLSAVEGDFVTIHLLPGGDTGSATEGFHGAFFEAIPGYEKGVALWRYKPWNAWTRPMLVSNPADLESWDVQFFYWQYNDGVYGAAMPLSGNGYRTTLGQHEGKFGSKSRRYGPGAVSDTIPQMMIGFGEKPFDLFKNLYAKGLAAMGKPENRIDQKVYPEKLDKIGWCTWNASENGEILGEDFVVDAVKT
ncbi:MAG: hypothetical protein AAFO69_11725, partial [Bacteroidota bacterium]